MIGLIVGYVDPGSGLLACQFLAAVVDGLIFNLKKSRDFLKSTALKLLRAGDRDERCLQAPPENRRPPLVGNSANLLRKKDGTC